jgi:hypothetical protein
MRARFGKNQTTLCFPTIMQQIADPNPMLTDLVVKNISNM